jgi:hypothetical protein
MKKNNNMLTSTFNKLASNKILTNKITLYIVMAIAFLSLYRYIIISEFSAVLLFFIIVALAYNFTKNMTIVLGSAFLVTSLVSMLKGFLGFKEGMTDEGDEEGDLGKKITDLVTNMKEDNSETEPKTKTKTKTTTSKKSQDTDDSNETSQKANYQNQIPLTPGLYNMPNKEQLTKQLGKASETEQAYDNLEKIMGSKNIQTMSNDTQDLIRQQNELIKQLKSMTPALNEAMTALGGLDLSKLTNMFNKIPEKGE